MLGNRSKLVAATLPKAGLPNPSKVISTKHGEREGESGTSQNTIQKIRRNMREILNRRSRYEFCHKAIYCRIEQFLRRAKLKKLPLFITAIRASTVIAFT
jgi:hypothetical protein